MPTVPALPWLWLCFLTMAADCAGYLPKRSGAWNGYHQFHTYPHPDKKPGLPRDVMVDVVNNLGLKLLAIHNEYNENNLAISPYGALSVLIALGEGLQGDAVREIQYAAQIPNDISIIRVGLRDIHRHLKSYFIPSEGFLAGLTLNHDNVTLNPEYEDILKYYGYDISAFNNALYPEPGTTEQPFGVTTDAATTPELVARGFETTTEGTTTVGDGPIVETTTVVGSTKPPTTPSVPEPEPGTAPAVTAEGSEEPPTTVSPTSTTNVAETPKTSTELDEVETTTLPRTTRDVVTTTTSAGDDTTVVAVTTEGNLSQETTTIFPVTTEPVTSTTLGDNTEMPTSVRADEPTIETIPSIEDETPADATTIETDQETTTEGIESTLPPEPVTQPKESPSVTEEILTTTAPTDVSTATEVVQEQTTGIDFSTVTETTATSNVYMPPEEQATETISEKDNTSIVPTTTLFEATPAADDISTDNDNEIMTPNEALSGEFRRQARQSAKNLIELNIYRPTESHKRSTRSVVDYVIARYYDDHFTPYHREETPYVPKEQLGFLVSGKYREYNINFMKYDTVLPFYYVPHLDALALRFPLDNTNYYLLLLLPVVETGVDRLICDLRLHGSLKYIINNLRFRHVIATIPSFMLKGYVTLTPTFQKLGIKEVFEPRQADFSPMTNQREIYVTNIEQAITVNIKNYVDPNTLEGQRNQHRYTPLEFKADHPFAYFVVDSELHVTLMAGKVVNPLNSRIR